MKHVYVYTFVGQENLANISCPKRVCKAKPDVQLILCFEFYMFKGQWYTWGLLFVLIESVQEMQYTNVGHVTSLC